MDLGQDVLEQQAKHGNAQKRWKAVVRCRRWAAGRHVFERGAEKHAWEEWSWDLRQDVTMSRSATARCMDLGQDVLEQHAKHGNAQKRWKTGVRCRRWTAGRHVFERGAEKHAWRGWRQTTRIAQVEFR